MASMSAGGAERVISYLTHDFILDGYEVVLVTLVGDYSYYSLHPDLKMISLLPDKNRINLINIVTLLYKIRKVVCEVKPDVIISFMDFVNYMTIIATMTLNILLIVSERNEPSAFKWRYARDLSRNILYRLATKIVVQTYRIQSYFTGNLLSKTEVIANPVPLFPKFSQSMLSKKKQYEIIAVGRLVPQKGFCTLIEAFSCLAEQYPDWSVRIFGEGRLHDQLANQIKHLGLVDRVHLAGLSCNISVELAQADLMVFPSLFEGFPNALAEGMSAGLPAIGFSGVSGVEDLIIDNQTGLLVTNKDKVGGIVKAMSILMQDEQKRVLFGNNARSHVRQWDRAVVFDQWRTLIESVSTTYVDAYQEKVGRNN